MLIRSDAIHALYDDVHNIQVLRFQALDKLQSAYETYLQCGNTPDASPIDCDHTQHLNTTIANLMASERQILNRIEQLKSIQAIEYATETDRLTEELLRRKQPTALYTIEMNHQEVYRLTDTSTASMQC